MGLQLADIGVKRRSGIFIVSRRDLLMINKLRQGWAKQQFFWMQQRDERNRHISCSTLYL